MYGGINIHHFDMLEIIGKGTYAKVVLVKKIDTKQIYALKILDKKKIEKLRNQEYIFVDRYDFFKFFQNLHPFIISMYYSFQSEKKLFFALEYCPGGELLKLLQKRKVFTEDQARFYAAQIVLALEYLHQNQKYIKCRNLKLEDVLIDAQGYIRITNFALDNYFSQGYGKPVDWRTLGVILYEMLTDLSQFQRQNREDLFESIKFAQFKCPPSLTHEAKSLLEILFHENTEKSLGTQEIKDHPWFLNINWDTLLKKAYEPPFAPLMKSDIEVSNFDPKFTDQPVHQVDPNSIPISESVNQKYAGFTYDEQNQLE